MKLDFSIEPIRTKHKFARLISVDCKVSNSITFRREICRQTQSSFCAVFASSKQTRDLIPGGCGNEADWQTKLAPVLTVPHGAVFLCS